MTRLDLVPERPPPLIPGIFSTAMQCLAVHIVIIGRLHGTISMDDELPFTVSAEVFIRCSVIHPVRMSTKTSELLVYLTHF